MVVWLSVWWWWWWYGIKWILFHQLIRPWQHLYLLCLLVLCQHAVKEGTPSQAVHIGCLHSRAGQTDTQGQGRRVEGGREEGRKKEEGTSMVQTLSVDISASCSSSAVIFLSVSLSLSISSSTVSEYLFVASRRCSRVGHGGGA